MCKCISPQRSPVFWDSSQGGGLRCCPRGSADLSLRGELRQPCVQQWEWRLKISAHAVEPRPSAPAAFCVSWPQGKLSFAENAYSRS